jgi:predicted nucleic acid-binding protein
VILDTNAVSALFRGDAGLEEVLSGQERHHLPVIVLGEYLYGLSGSGRSQVLEVLLDALAGESVVLPVDARTARSYAEVRRRLRRAGTPIPENDVWIAALARQHDLPVVSRDRHFDTVKGLVRIDF